MVKKKTFWDYMNSPDYVQDMRTGEFVHIKTGKRINFNIKLKKVYEN